MNREDPSSQMSIKIYKHPKGELIKGRIIQFGVVFLWLVIAVAQLSGSRVGSGIATLLVGGALIWKFLGFKQELNNRRLGLAYRFKISSDIIEAWAPYWKHISLNWDEISEVRELELSNNKGLLLISQENSKQIAVVDLIPGFNDLRTDILSKTAHLLKNKEAVPAPTSFSAQSLRRDEVSQDMRAVHASTDVPIESPGARQCLKFGIYSLLLFPLGPVAVVKGIRAYRDASADSLPGKGTIIVGILLGCIGALFCILFAFVLFRAVFWS